MGKGRQLNWSEMGKHVQRAEGTHNLGWSHITFLATMYAESEFYEWVRPIVFDPGAVHHLSVDRGVCQLNSHWWSDVEDAIAYDPELAVAAAIGRIKHYVADGYKGSAPWKWSPILDWLWHGYGTPTYKENVGRARQAVNEVRSEGGLPPI